MKNIDESNYLQEMFVKEAKPAMDRHSGGGTDTLTEFLSWRNGRYLFYEDRNLTTVPLFDTSNVTNMENMFYNCTNLTEVPAFDTSNVTNMGAMLRGCTNLTAVPLFDTSNVTNMHSMLQTCSTLTEVPLFDTSNVTDMGAMFSGCTNITSVPLFNTSKVTVMAQMFSTCYALTTIPLLDTSNVTSMNYLFQSCKALTTVPALDARNVGYFNTTFSGCANIKDIGIRNIKATLQVSNGTSYGHLLTVDSLVHLIYELRKQYYSQTLTVGTANLEKLANVYVKTITITDEMRAEDDLIDEKYPFVVCESTDEGAMLITDYATTVKNWTIK